MHACFPHQNILLLLISLPAYAVYLHGSAPFGTHPLDYVAAGLIVFFVALETAADQQQWNFQNEKYAKRAYVQCSLPFPVLPLSAACVLAGFCLHS